MPGIKRKFYDVCPACWSVRVKFRVFKEPRYKCEKCGSEFMNKKRISHEDRIFFNDVLKLTRMKTKQIEDMVDDKTLRKIIVKTLKEYFKLCVK
jgi:hypothetical protein